MRLLHLAMQSHTALQGTAALRCGSAHLRRVCGAATRTRVRQWQHGLVRCQSTSNGTDIRWLTQDSDAVPTDLDAVVILAGP